MRATWNTLDEAGQAAVLCSAGLPHGYIGMPWAFLPDEVQARLTALDLAEVEAAVRSAPVPYAPYPELEGLTYYSEPDEPARARNPWDALVQAMDTVVVTWAVMMEQLVRMLSRPTVLGAIVCFLVGLLIGRAASGR